jgi:hypothetical protein
VLYISMSSEAFEDCEFEIHTLLGSLNLTIKQISSSSGEKQKTLVSNSKRKFEELEDLVCLSSYIKLLITRQLKVIYTFYNYFYLYIYRFKSLISSLNSNQRDTALDYKLDIIK